MKSVSETEATNRLDAILDEAQREPIVIRRQDRDIAVVLSLSDRVRFRRPNGRRSAQDLSVFCSQAPLQTVRDSPSENRSWGRLRRSLDSTIFGGLFSICS